MYTETLSGFESSTGDEPLKAKLRQALMKISELIYTNYSNPVAMNKSYGFNCEVTGS